MRGKLLLFGFESLLNILALEGAVKPFQVELVPVGRTDYNKPMAVLAGNGKVIGVNVDNKENREKKRGRAMLIKNNQYFVVGDKGIQRQLE